MIDSTIRSGSYIVFLCFPFSLVPVATAILGGELLWTSVSPLVSECGREGPLFAVLGVFAGLRLWLLVLSALLARLLWHASAAVARFGCRGFFWGSLWYLCVWSFSWTLGVGYFLSSAPIMALTCWGGPLV